jgi:hypothetical protein
MKYLFLLHTSDDGPPEDVSSAEYAQIYAEYNVATTAMAKAGMLIECAPLQPWTSATRPGPRRRDHPHRRAGRGDQGAGRRLHAGRVRRPGEKAGGSVGWRHDQQPCRSP